MRYTILLAVIAVTSSHAAQIADHSQSATANILTAEQQREGWTLLFDGKTTGGWHRYN
ncbi:MAG: DUF1080 domain-containing protein, partial [Proteobacteria bacterium]|nr:DUF1080 domain-containing protein [Pseudomonadota bacterium]